MYLSKTASANGFIFNQDKMYQVRCYTPVRPYDEFAGKFQGYDPTTGLLHFICKNFELPEPDMSPYEYLVKPSDVILVNLVREGECFIDFDAHTWERDAPLTESVVPVSANDVNEGNSNYNTFKIQPWDIWEEYNLNPWDADLVKRVLRTKQDAGMTADEQRILDYKKMIHICNKRIEMLTKGK